MKKSMLLGFFTLMVFSIGIAQNCEDMSDCQEILTQIKKEKNDAAQNWVCSLFELEEACQKTCGYCGACKDTRTDCAYYKGQGECAKPHLAKYCRKTCGKC